MIKGNDVFTLKSKVLVSDKFNDINVVFTTNINSGEGLGNNMAFQVSEDKKRVIKNREDLSLMIHRPIDSFVFSKQTHGVNCVKVDASFKGKGLLSYEDGIDDTDALYTKEHGVALCCFFADCTPIYFSDEVSGIVGIIHSGWQGTVTNITEHVIEKLISEENVDPSNLKFIIGPSIKKESFEVSEDVYNKFLNSKYIKEDMISIKSSGKWLIDTDAYNKNLLICNGVKEENIFISDIDTFKEKDLFSYRRDNKTGRMLGVIFK